MGRLGVIILIVHLLVCVPAGQAHAARVSAREFNSGVSLFKRGEFDLASDVFKQLLDKYPDAEQIDEVKYWYAETRDRLKDYPAALDYYKKIVSDHPQSKFQSRALFGAGYAAYRLNQFQDASSYFADASAKSEEPEIIGESLIMSAYCFNQLNEPAQAESKLRDLLARPALDKKYILDARYELGRILINSGRDSEAISMLKPVTENPSHPRQAAAMLAIGDVLYAKSRFRESVEWYENVLKNKQSTDDMLARAQWNAAWSEMTTGNDTSAESRFKAVTSMDSVSDEIKSDAWLRTAIIARRGGQDGTAGWRAHQALAIADSAGIRRLQDEVRLFLAESAYLKNKYDSAMDILNAVQAQNYPFHQLKGQIYFDSRRFSEALPCFQKAVESAADSDRRNTSSLDLAQTYFNLKSYDDALNAAGKLQDPAGQQAQNRLELTAKIYMATGKYKESAESYAELAGRKSDSAGVTEALYFSALGYYRAEMNDDAKKQLDRLFALNPTPTDGGSVAGGQGWPERPPPSQYRAGAVVLLGDVFLKLGKPDSALKQFWKAIDEAEDTDVIYLAYTHLITQLLKTDTAAAVTSADSFADRLPEGRTFQFVMESLYGAKQYSDVVQYSSRALKTLGSDEPAKARVAYYDMAANFEIKNFKAAGESLRRLSTYIQEKSPADTLAEEAVFWECRIAQSQADPARTRAAYQTYLDSFPSGKYVRDARFNLGLIAFDAGGQEEAEKQFTTMLAGRSAADAAASGDEMYVNAVYNLASVRIARKDYAGAREMLAALEKSPALSADPGYRYKRGYVEMQLGQTQTAENLYAGIIADPAVSRQILDKALQTLADLYYHSDRADDLIGMQDKKIGAVEDPEARSHVFYLIGMTYFNREQFDTAAKMFKEVKDTPDTALLAEAWLRQADCQYNLGNYDRAYRDYDAVRSKYEDIRWDDEAVYSQGLCQIKLGLKDAAISTYETFLKTHAASPMAPNMIIESANLYFKLGKTDQAMEKIKLIESSSDNAFKQDASRLRVKIAEKNNNPEEIFKETARHTTQFGAEGDVVLVAVQAAVAASKFDDALKMLDGVQTDKFKPDVAARIDFYKAESSRNLGKSGADEIYQRLSGVSDSEVRMSASYRYAGYLVDHGQADQAMAYLAPVLAGGQSFKFYEESILFGLTASKKAGLNELTMSIYETYANRLSTESSRVTGAEAWYSACLARANKEQALKAAETLLGYKVSPRRRRELILSSASLNEDLNHPEKAQGLYDKVISDPDADADLLKQSMDRRVQMAMNRGAAGRDYLMSFLTESPDPRRGYVAAEKLLADAMDEKRYKDVVRVVDIMAEKLPSVPASARYRAAVAKLAMSDTASALKEFKTLAEASSPDTYYQAWSALKLAEQSYAQKSYPSAEPLLRRAWAGRANLTDEAAVTAYKMLADIYLDAEDYTGMEFLAAEPAPAGVNEEADLIKGFAAFHRKDFAEAARHLKQVESKEARAKRAFAESLVGSGDTPAGIKVLDDLSLTRGATAAAAAYRIAQLYDLNGDFKQAVISYYNVLDQYEPDENAAVAPQAMLGIIRIQVRNKQIDKAKKTLDDLEKKYPKSKEAEEAEKTVKR